MNTFFNVADISDQEIMHGIESRGGFDTDVESSIKDMSFYEFTLKELGLPDSQTLLQSILNIENSVGLHGWKTGVRETNYYKGFSLTYNPDYTDTESSVFHQTWGSRKLKQNFSRALGIGNYEENTTKNTYYDSYAFRKVNPLIKHQLGYLLDRFRFPLVRSRVAYFYGYNTMPNRINTWHVDEFPYHVLRINIPVQTSEEYILDIAGKDDFGNECYIKNKHLETEKLYIWNTRIPHRIGINKFCKFEKPRIGIVLGFCPWFDYDEDNDRFVKNEFWGMNISKIVTSIDFMKKNNQTTL